MNYLDTNSLFRTVDNVSEALLFGFDIEVGEKAAIADFIISRQNNDAYAGTFAPTENDSKQELIVFTGERIKSRAGRYHMIGEEASGILRRLDLHDEKTDNALRKADDGLKKQINKSLENPRYEYGMYCCKSCSCALWINLASGGLDNDSKMLKAGLNYLRKHRDNKGSWKGFPVYYTLYVLNEIDFSLAKDELKYAGFSVERKYKKQKSDKSKYDLRRDFIYEQILNKINND